ncbi:MAG: phosphoribosylamine--glycine ligase [Coriobacteriales bacterium]|jgi:phosphoribosylamine--glycine ligase
MDILLLGSGGREHAIAASLARSPRCDRLYVAPGNGGTAGIATNVELDANDGDAVVAFAREHGVGLVVIGPEAPLVAGVADAVRAAGIPCFGPGASGARMEGSKSFSKAFMGRHGIPTADYRVFDAAPDARAYVGERFAAGVPTLVVKADGLAAGKGVVVASSEAEALEAVDECFGGHFGAAGATVVIEEGLTGPECSLLVFTDGRTMRPMATAQDHKRAYDGDLGPNTGGMGCYSPVPIVTPAELDEMTADMRRAVDGLAQEGIDYRGVLYGGFMLTPRGPRVLEFNARFGDPETQVILPRLETDLVDVMMAVAQGRLDEVELKWSDSWAVTVVLTSKGYPVAYEKGFAITGVADAEALDGVTVYHAGTALGEDGVLRTAGGRVLDVTATGPTFAEARDLAYRACDLIDFEGKTLRTDVGLRALRGRDAWGE